MFDGGGEIAAGCGTERLMNGGELFDGHGAGLIQPAQIGGEVGDRGLDQHPAASGVHVLKTAQDPRVGPGGRVPQQRAQLRIG